MLNKTIFIGRFTKDPEIRKSTSGNTIASFSVAVDSPLQNPDGTRGTTYLDCVAFNKQAENIANFTRKGSKVCVEGSLNQRAYVVNDGSKRKVLEVIVDSIGFLDKKAEAEEAQEVTEEPKYDAFTGKPLNAKPSK